MLKKAFIVILVLVFTMSGVFAATTTKKKKKPYISKTIEVTTQDSHIMKAQLMYPRTPKGVKVKNPYPVIIFLHSLGYSSSQWKELPYTFVKQGYAVMLVDLRGHGISNKDAKFRVKSWTYFTPKIYKKYPSDVIALINTAKQTNKKVSFSNYAVIGGDIGANTGVLVGQTLPVKPKAMVLLTPYQQFKGLNIFDYQLGTTPILVMCCKSDKYAVCQEVSLKTFSKGKFVINNTNYPINGMMILQHDAACKKKTIEFINQNMPAKK